MKDVPFHEAAGIFPMMEEATFREFKADVEKHGVHEPAEIIDGKIPDGLNLRRGPKERNSVGDVGRSGKKRVDKLTKKSIIARGG